MIEFMNWQHWLKGLIAAIVNGFASGVVLIVAVPDKFNLEQGFPLLLKTSAVFAILGAANYLKQSPVPPDEAQKTETTTKDQTNEK